MNGKYAAIRAKVDSSNQARFVHTLSPQQIAKRRGEGFRRMSSCRLYDWLRIEAELETSESVYDWGTAPEAPPGGSVCSYGGTDLDYDSFNGLLIDLRNFEEYKKSRISNSTNFPGILFTRDIFSPQLLLFKKKRPDRPLILYHQDDRQGSIYAKLLVEKGWEDVWVLNGGFEEFQTLYPELVNFSN